MVAYETATNTKSNATLSTPSLHVFHFDCFINTHNTQRRCTRFLNKNQDNVLECTRFGERGALASSEGRRRWSTTTCKRTSSRLDSHIKRTILLFHSASLRPIKSWCVCGLMDTSSFMTTQGWDHPTQRFGTRLTAVGLSSNYAHEVFCVGTQTVHFRITQ